eukprot:m.98170 g.98170  ORF g.98170 m.98170 type:complete len:59 (+) comp14859_c0_seq3:1281-1457(+)
MKTLALVITKQLKRPMHLFSQYSNAVTPRPSDEQHGRTRTSLSHQELNLAQVTSNFAT